HTIVPARDKTAAAQFFARILGLHADPKDGHFAPVCINDTLTLLFDDDEEFESHPRAVPGQLSGRSATLKQSRYTEVAAPVPPAQKRRGLQPGRGLTGAHPPNTAANANVPLAMMASILAV